ncbi:hypothetical protein [Sharpea porci]|uniref:hypothetical protein n=1 Tax=Sharpea porci TaxID=2652286 RepID=UPI0012B188CA|nr:hypothetical protein [Sharpea porci]
MKTVLKCYGIYNNSESRKMKAHYTRKDKHKQTYGFRINVVKVEKRWLVDNPRELVASM